MNKKEKTKVEFSVFCNQHEFDQKTDEYKKYLINIKSFNNSYIFYNQFYLINDLFENRIAYIHPNIESVTGYNHRDLLTYDQFLNFIHPDDSETVIDNSRMIISTCKQYKEKYEPFHPKIIFSIDFRYRHINGEYIKLNRQTTCFSIDKLGNLVFSIDLFTEVKNSINNKELKINLLEEVKYNFELDNILEKFHKRIRITKREIDILRLLSEGESATTIAKKLCLSIHTIISHRKHMIEKTGTKNTADLVRYAIKNGLI